MRNVALIFGALVLWVSQAQASHMQSATLGGTGRAAGIRTDSAAPLEQGHWIVGLGVDYSFYDQLSEQELIDARMNDPEGSLHSLDSLWSVNLDASYGLTRDVTLGVHLPYVTRNDIIEASETDVGEIEHLGDSSGLGSLTLYALWRVYEDAATDTNFGLIGGFNLPTGEDNKVADTGETFETEFQPSDGSFDEFAGVAWSRSIGKVSVAASTIYTLTGKGTQSTNLGDSWTYNAGAGYSLGEHAEMGWNAVLELNGGWRAREKVDGDVDPNSGGSWLYLSPGVTVTGHSWTAYASWGYPIDKSINGVQDKLDSRFLVGVQYQH